MRKELETIKFSLLDCTLRDGGYYTNWDFDAPLVDEYLSEISKLPVDYVEIGYRSKPAREYAGEFYYLPLFVLEACKRKTDKKLAVILNEKDVRLQDLDELLQPCMGVVDLIRLAVAPANIERALDLANKVKSMHFKVSFNLMYASEWEEGLLSDEVCDALNKNTDYLYVVDSYGGMYPTKVSKIFSALKKRLRIKLGFHGHNNIEMALVNSLVAIENGADIIDATICGMGRGAGNLKTELLLTVLHQKYKLAVDFDPLNKLTQSFLDLKKRYKWGGSLPYMVSGAFSLPQRRVVSQIKKRYISLNSIVEKVGSGSDLSKSKKHDFFKSNQDFPKVLIVGGGNSSKRYSEALLRYLADNPEMAIIHSSSKNVKVFEGVGNLQFHCLPGREGKRLEGLLSQRWTNKRIMVLPPQKYSGSYVPEQFLSHTKILKQLKYSVDEELSATAMALEIASTISAKEVLLTGYDGYEDPIKKEELELFEENEMIFKLAMEQMNIKALTPTYYSVPSTSIFSLL